MLVTSKEILTKAKEGHYGIGAFNALDIATVDAIITSAEETNTPIIVQFGDSLDPNAAESRRMSYFEAKNFMHYLRYRAEISRVPVAIHLDHCRTYDGCIRAMQFGATSVMIDGSMLPFEENIALTKKVLAEASSCNVSVEAEIGHVSGHDGDTSGGMYTTVEEAVSFYEQTGVDLLAVAIGTVHGVYREKPELKYDRIRELREAIPAPLVMHGASGLEPEQYEECVRCGITKINFATYMLLAGAEGMRKCLDEAGENKVPFQTVLKAGMEAEKEIIKRHIGYFKTESV